MRWSIALACVLGQIVPLVAQTLAPKPSAIQHVTVAVNGPSDAVTPGSTVTLSVEVTPKPNIHVYASGAKGFTPVALILSPSAGILAGKPTYPPAELLDSPGSDAPVPVYHKPFRILQPVTIARTAKAGEMFNVAGVLNYESCDDRMCFPMLSIPLNWSVRVR